MDPRIETTINLMRVNLDKHLTLPRLGQSVNLSPDRLRHVFKDEIGVSPTRYLRYLRMQWAKQLLETTFLSVKEITAAVGLHSESHLVTDFRRAYGVTPAQYRATRKHTLIEHDDQQMPDSHFGQ